MSGQSASEDDRASRESTGNVTESSLTYVSPTYQQISALYPQLCEDVILDLMRIHQHNPRNFQLELQQANRSLHRHGIRKPVVRVRAQTDGLHRSRVSARRPALRRNEKLPKSATVTDAEDEERTLLPTLPGGGGCNGSDRVEVGDEEETRTKGIIVTWPYNRDSAEASEDMEIDSGITPVFPDSSFAATTRAPPGTPELTPGFKPPQDEQRFSTARLVEALSDNTACVDEEEMPLSDSHSHPMPWPTSLVGSNKQHHAVSPTTYERAGRVAGMS